MTRVVCAGHVNWDVTIQVDALPAPDGEARITDQRQAGGGSASNAAVVLSGLDVGTTLLGSVGTDEYGLLARRELDGTAVDTVLVETSGAPTAVKYLLVDGAGEVMVLANDGANEAFAASDLPEDSLAAATNLHLTNQAPETALALARRGGQAGLTVSFDPGRTVGERAFGPVLDHVDLLFCNDREASALPDDHGVPSVVVKHGSQGATWYGPDGTRTHDGFAVEPVDTSGAGDAFAAGFLAARGTDFDVDPLAVANACGALAARTPGARLHVGWRDVHALLDIGPASD